ncbi:MAG: hypothetical protein OXC99_04350 [Chloroflexi bacterium]|nr:hypothetical protein [Chloroflexota bacterium]
MTESNWMKDRVPELIWIALLNHVFGVEEGTALALSIAKAAAECNQNGSRAYAAASDYRELDEEQKVCIRSTLSAGGKLARAHEGLAALIYNYSEFPLAFLAQSVQPNDGFRGSTLSELKETISSIVDREGTPGIFAQATVVYIYMVNGKCTVALGTGLANLPAIEDYPATDESLRVAASIRSAVTFMLRPLESREWPTTFWTQGRTLEPCEVDN